MPWARPFVVAPKNPPALVRRATRPPEFTAFGNRRRSKSRTQIIDGFFYCLHASGIRIGEVQRIGRCRIDEIAQTDADQPKGRIADPIAGRFPGEKYPAGPPEDLGKLGGVVQRMPPRSDSKIRGLEL